MKAQKSLFLILKKEFFDQIASGEKVIEYREATTYWRNRLNRPFNTVLFQLGYEKEAPRLIAEVISIDLVDDHFEIAISNAKDAPAAKVGHMRHAAKEAVAYQ
jgi:hypothetical protein